MKKLDTIRKSAIAACLALLSSQLAWSADNTATHPIAGSDAAEQYILDPSHSHVLWHINHFGFSNPSGKWMAKGNLSLDKKNLEKSKVDVTIDVGDFITGNPELDKHLKSKLFFDVDEFPTATFISDKVDLNNNEISKVHGTLTVRGVSKPVTLDVKMNKMGKNPITENETVGFSASTKINRSSFGITSFLPKLGDEVTLNIEVEAYQPKAEEN